MRRFRYAKPIRIRHAGVRSAAVGLLASWGLLAACTGTSSSQVEVKTPKVAPKTTTTTPPPDCADVLPPSAQAGQLLMVMVTAPRLAEEGLDAAKIGGFGLKGRQSAKVGDEVEAAAAKAPVAAFVASDEEGGTVQRLVSALGELPSAAQMAKGTPDAAAKTFGTYSKAMVAAGFNMVLGPDADVGGGSDLGTRSFGDDPATVAGFATAIVEAQQDAGLISVVKHWPGIGGGSDDPHDELYAIAPLSELGMRDLIPFEQAIAAGVKGVMVAHVEVPGLTEPGVPASLSRAAITDQLRGHEKFDGLVMTDSLGMGAVVNTVPQDEAAERAIAAGADIALLSGADVIDAAHSRVTDAIAAGRIPAAQVAASVRRVLKAKGITGECPDLVASLASAQQDSSQTSAAQNSTVQNPAAQNSTVQNPAAHSPSGNGAGDRDTGINDVPTPARQDSSEAPIKPQKAVSGTD